jgi:SAM-dependent methyltransferase
VTDADPTGWFERLYEAAARGERIVPWDRGGPSRLLAEWARSASAGDSRRALVVGSGLGDDAELVASLGYATVAFDVAPTAVATARERFPGSPVDYRVADLLDPPAGWRDAFDLVVESLTVQSLPPALHPQATANVAGFVAPGGTLLVIASAADTPPASGPPWPLTRSEVDAFADGGLRALRVEDLDHGDDRRWRAELRRGP